MRWHTGESLDLIVNGFKVMQTHSASPFFPPFIYYGLYNSLRNVSIYLITVETLPMASDL